MRKQNSYNKNLTNKGYLTAKILILTIALLMLIFFGNDYMLIDIEETAIITAVAVDYDENADKKYLVTAQIAVPEATDTNAESSHTELSGEGNTVGAAVKMIGDMSGWFPHLSFCNLIVLGNDLAQKTDVIEVLDYFAQTLRMQDSAMVVLAEKKAAELLSIATPLDTLSSFALQRVLFKNPGFDTDVAVNNIKDFCVECYGVANSSFMPLVKTVKKKGEDSAGESSGDMESGGSESGGSESGGSGGSGSGKKQADKTFMANQTALFYGGKRVGALTEEQTLCFNALREDLSGTTLEIDGVAAGLAENANYLITILKNKAKIKLSADSQSLKLDIKLDITCKLSDKTVPNNYEQMGGNQPVPAAVLEKAKSDLTENLTNLIEISRRTGCDFLKIKEKLYRYNYKFYPQYKDVYLERLEPNVQVSVKSPK